MKAIIKSYGHVVTDFYKKEIPIVDYSHTSLALINLALKKDGNYYLQVFLKHWEKVIRHIIDDLESSSFSDEFDGE